MGYMAAIEQWGRGGGETRRALKIFLILAVSALMAGCAADPAPLKISAAPQRTPDDILMPWRIIKGGRLAARQDPNGFPALTAHVPDLYIADAGAGRIYRYYADLQALNVVPGVTATTRTRLQMAADWSLLVLDPAHSSITRLSRGGQLLQTVVSPLTSSHRIRRRRASG